MKTLEMKGSIQGVEVMVLIDGGASHNRMSLTRKSLTSSRIPTLLFSITVGHAHKVWGKEGCPAVPVLIQGYLVTEDFLLLDEIGIEVILGIQWLWT